MLADYKGQPFDAEYQRGTVCLWKYVPVKGFDKVVTSRGRMFFEKTVSPEEVSDLYSVRFKAYINGRGFILDRYNEDSKAALIICNDYEFAKANGFAKREHGIWQDIKSLDCFEKIMLIKKNEKTGKKEKLSLSKDEFETAYIKYCVEV